MFADDGIIHGQPWDTHQMGSNGIKWDVLGLPWGQVSYPGQVCIHEMGCCSRIYPSGQRNQAVNQFIVRYN